MATLSGPVTAAERAARWGHQGGVLALDGPAELIDAIERSLFATGVITQRIDRQDAGFCVQPGLLESIARLNAQDGFLVLDVTANESEQLVAQVGVQRVVAQAVHRNAAVAAVHRLLHETANSARHREGGTVMSTLAIQDEVQSS